MQALIDLLLEYWIIPVGAAVLLGPSAYSYFSKKISTIKFKLPSFKKKETPIEVIDDADSLIEKDLNAVYWLAKRAVDVNDETLVAEMESVNKKIYYIHCNMRKSATSTK
jgi:hypothetical protein